MINELFKPLIAQLEMVARQRSAALDNHQMATRILAYWQYCIGQQRFTPDYVKFHPSSMNLVWRLDDDELTLVIRYSGQEQYFVEGVEISPVSWFETIQRLPVREYAATDIIDFNTIMQAKLHADTLLKLWLVTRTDPAQNSTWLSTVVAARTPEEALLVPPSPDFEIGDEGLPSNEEWFKCTAKTVTCIGTAAANVTPNCAVHGYYYHG